MPSNEPSSGESEVTASADLQFQTQKVILRAVVSAPASEAPSIVGFARGGLMLISGVLCLVLGLLGTALMFQAVGGVGAAATAVVMSAFAGGLIGTGGLAMHLRPAPSHRPTTTFLVTPAGRPSVVYRPPGRLLKVSGDERPPRREAEDDRARSRRAEAKRRRARRKKPRG